MDFTRIPSDSEVWDGRKHPLFDYFGYPFLVGDFRPVHGRGGVCDYTTILLGQGPYKGVFVVITHQY